MTEKIARGPASYRAAETPHPKQRWLWLYVMAGVVGILDGRFIGQLYGEPPPIAFCVLYWLGVGGVLHLIFKREPGWAWVFLIGAGLLLLVLSTGPK
jgi:hypothetical protein